MSRLHRIVLLLTALALPGVAGAAAPPWRLVDRYGDPLPAGAVARLGTIRWRYRSNVPAQQSAISPDGRWLLTQLNVSALQLWEASTGRLMRNVERPPSEKGYPFWDYAFLPKSGHLLSHDPRARTYWLWEFPSFRLIKRWAGTPLNGILVSADDRLAAGMTERGAIHVFNLRSGKGRRIYACEPWQASFAFTSDGCLTVLEWTARTTYTVVRLDLLTGHVVRRFQITAGRPKLAPDGEHVAATDTRGELTVWCVNSGRKLRLAALPEKGELTLSFRPDGKVLLAIQFEPLSAWVFDLGRGELRDRGRLQGHMQDFFNCGQVPVLARDGRVAYLQDFGVFTRVNLRNGRQLDNHDGFSNYVEGLTWTADGRSLVAVARSDLTRWDAGTGRLVARASTGDQYPGSLLEHVAWAIAPDGGTLAFSPWKSHVIDFVDFRTGNKSRQLTGHGAHLLDLAFSADGRQLVSLDANAQVRIWDVATRSSACVLDARKTAKTCKAVRFTPDGKHVVLVEDSGRSHLWDVRARKHLRTLGPADEHRDAAVSAVAISPAGEWLAVAYGERSHPWKAFANEAPLRVWNLATDREEPGFEAQPQPQRGLFGGNGIPTIYPSLSFSADGRFLARNEEELVLYEVASGRIVHRFEGRFHAAVFHPSLLRLATANEERLDVLVWDLKPLFLSKSTSRSQMLPTLWAGLTDSDAASAQQASWTLTVMAGMEAFLAERLTPVPRLAGASLGRWIDELGSDDFAIREKSEESLRAADEAAAPAMRKALHAIKDLEQRKRLERLLARLDSRSPEALRQHRAILALEVRGTPEAQQLLERLATGLPGARLTEEAKAALRRLRTRP